MYAEYYVYKSGDILITKGVAYVISQTKNGLTTQMFEAGETWHRRSNENELFLYITSSRVRAKDFIKEIDSDQCKRVYSTKVDKETKYLETEYDPDYVW